MSLSKSTSDYCNCLRGDATEKGCRGARCGPLYPWNRPKKNAEVIFAAIKSLSNPSKLNPDAVIGPCPCASGVWASDARSIFKAIGEQNKRAVAANLIPLNKNKWLDEQREKYYEAMVEKYAAFVGIL